MGHCEFFLEVANSAEERAVGLMGRESMERDRGMLFVFSAEQVLGFWMKNTLIPLDIIFIDSDLSVVDVQTMRPEHEIAPDPLPTYYSAAPGPLRHRGERGCCGGVRHRARRNCGTP